MSAASSITACLAPLHTGAEVAYLGETRVMVPGDQQLAVGHRACSMLASGASEDDVVTRVWGSRLESVGMVSSAHVNLCPDV
jgi:hypothetical protein